MEEQARIVMREKAKFLIKGICQYNNLDITSKKVGRHLKRSAVTWWRIGNHQMGEWNGRKGDRLYNMYERYEGEAAKASNAFHKIMDSLDPVMYR